VVSCDLLALESAGVKANKITAESGRNDFNIAASSKSDAGFRHLLEPIHLRDEL
jgi:hypothetical protein